MIIVAIRFTRTRKEGLCMTLQGKGFGVIIAAARMAAALPGVVLAYTSLPVPGVPLDNSLPARVDAFVSICSDTCRVLAEKAVIKNPAVLAASVLASGNRDVASEQSISNRTTTDLVLA